MSKKFFIAEFPQRSLAGFFESCEEIKSNLIPANQPVIDWNTPILLNSNEQFSDFSNSIFAHKICSERLKNIIERFASEDDPIQWLPLIVKNKQGVEKKYFELHFTQKNDVLSKTASTFDKFGMLISPVFEYEKIQNKNLFSHSNSRSLIVSEKLKQAIQDAGCTDIIFFKVPVIYNPEEKNKIA